MFEFGVPPGCRGRFVRSAGVGKWLRVEVGVLLVYWVGGTIGVAYRR